MEETITLSKNGRYTLKKGTDTTAGINFPYVDFYRDSTRFFRYTPLGETIEFFNCSSARDFTPALCKFINLGIKEALGKDGYIHYVKAPPIGVTFNFRPNL